MTEMDRSIELGAQYLFLVVWRQKTLFLFTSAVFFLAVIWVALNMRPTYEATAQLISGQGGLDEVSPGNRKPVEMPAALSIIAESDEVLRAAVEKVGLDHIVGQPASDEPSLRENLREGVAFLRAKLGAGAAAVQPANVTRMDALLPVISKGLSVRTDAKADTLSISYRHPDPVVAAKVANAVAQEVIGRQIEIYSRPGAAAFFAHQRERFEQNYKQASEELERFSTATRIYSAADQRELLLKRLSDLSSALAITRGQIADKTGERQALADSLRRLAPVARSPYVSGLVDSLGGERGGVRATDPRLDDRTTDPPLLLIRVYQDSMAALFKLNAELAGVQSLLQQQTAELANITAELNLLSQNQLRSAELHRAVDQATYNLDAFSKRAIDEQITVESNTARFSSVKVLQPAVAPISPVSPNMTIMAALAIGGGLLAGLTTALLRHWTRRPASRVTSSAIAL